MIVAISKINHNTSSSIGTANKCYKEIKTKIIMDIAVDIAVLEK